MKPMLPTLLFEHPRTGNWRYEVKYDGFRGILSIDKDKKVTLSSRNEKDLLPQFPEIEQSIIELLEEEKVSLPLVLDGEIILFRSKHCSQFHRLQVRGRMKTKKKIKEAAESRPCAFLAFDILQNGDKLYSTTSYLERKKVLEKAFESYNLPLSPTPYHRKRIQMVPSYKNFEEVWRLVQAEEGEGIVLKQEKSKWEVGKRTETWAKMKNWKIAQCFVTSFDSKNGYYEVAVYNEKEIFPIGSFYFGISPKEKSVLNEIIRNNASRHYGSKYLVHPSICVELLYLDWYEEQLREPHFHRFLFDSSPEFCTLEQFRLDEASLPEEVDITHPDKPLWKDPSISKLDYIRYLRKISPAILPFLNNRLLTVIRFPHGMYGEPFYQKNSPDYAPDFIKAVKSDDINYIVCNDLRTLMWLGNQIAIEFHIPFQKYNEKHVNEIVFDLDPPSRDDFALAVKAAQIMKDLFEQLQLKSFVKTSGNKGLQIYIPLPSGYGWEETRLFTEFIAEYLTSNFPDDFTTERLKKNRKGRLYVDYIQHSEGKTIIAPYSPRGNEEALVATPLWWEEVDENLDPKAFTMEVVLQRFEQLGCPFGKYELVKEEQPFDEILKFLRQNK